MTLPTSRVVSAEITRLTSFPALLNFGVPLLVVSTTGLTNAVDATTRTKVYSSIDEVAVDWDVTSQEYIALTQAFAQLPRIQQIKVGYRDPANDPVAELNLIKDFDNAWVRFSFTKELRDDYAVIGPIAAWAEAEAFKYFRTTSSDLDHYDIANTTTVTKQLRTDNRSRTSVEFHSQAFTDDLYPDLCANVFQASRDYDQVDSHYTMKFQDLTPIPVDNLTNAQVQAVTGFVPGTGLVESQGHYANAFVDIGGHRIYAEGNSANGEFQDIIHTADWLLARIQSEVVGLFASGNVVPFTDAGTQLIVSRVTFILNRAVAAGILSERLDVDGVTVLPAYEISSERVAAISQAQVANRIGPSILFCARLSGAQHYTDVLGKIIT